MTHKELISQLRSLASQLQNTAVTLTEALEPKAEQVQPPVQQPDAALCTNEPPGSAAGNPDGPHWTEGFEAFLKEQLELAEMAHRSNPCGPTSVRPRTLKMVMDAFLFHRGQGAA